MTSTPTATTPADLLIDGYVTVNTQFHTMGCPVAGVEVSVRACGAPAVTTTTAGDGYYSLALPGSDLIGCDAVTMEVIANSYMPWMETLPVEDLASNPHVNVALRRATGMWSWLPLVVK